MIPTKGRPEKLAVCLRSIPDWVDVFIVATQESDIPRGIRNAHILIDPKMSVPQAFNYMVSKSSGDIVMASDDIEYDPQAFHVLTSLLTKHGRDVVIGMGVSNMECNEDAFQCIGKTFKDEHAPLYHEGYKHFYIDTEVGDLARSLGKFVYCPSAHLKNFHPNSGCAADATHTQGRSEKLFHDQELYFSRRGKRLSMPQESV